MPLAGAGLGFGHASRVVPGCRSPARRNFCQGNAEQGLLAELGALDLLERLLKLLAGNAYHLFVVTGFEVDFRLDRKSTRLNSSHSQQSRMPSSA